MIQPSSSARFPPCSTHAYKWLSFGVIWLASLIYNQLSQFLSLCHPTGEGIVCLPPVANPRFPPKALFPLQRGKIYVRQNIASCVFCSTTPFCSKKRLPLQGAAICSEVANCGKGLAVAAIPPDGIVPHKKRIYEQREKASPHTGKRGQVTQVESCHPP